MENLLPDVRLRPHRRVLATELLAVDVYRKLKAGQIGGRAVLVPGVPPHSDRKAGPG